MKYFAILAPAVEKAILQQTNMTHADIFVELVQHTKLGVTPDASPATITTSNKHKTNSMSSQSNSTSGDTKSNDAVSISTTSGTPTPFTEDELILQMATPYDSILYIIWI